MGQAAPTTSDQNFVAMRHSACGEVALLVDAVVVDHPGRKILAQHLAFPDGSRPKAGTPLRCKSCGGLMRLGPPDLQIDRGPDHRRSLWQKVALVASRFVLGDRTVVKPW